MIHKARMLLVKSTNKGRTRIPENELVLRKYEDVGEAPASGWNAAVVVELRCVSSHSAV